MRLWLEFHSGRLLGVDEGRQSASKMASTRRHHGVHDARMKREAHMKGGRRETTDQGVGVSCDGSKRKRCG